MRCFSFIVLLLGYLVIVAKSNAQEPKYTPKLLVDSYEEGICNKHTVLNNDSFVHCTSINTIVYDIDDNKTTFIKIEGNVLILIKGRVINDKKEGVFYTYVFEKNSGRKHLIWEQQYANDKLNGYWKFYTLESTLYSVNHYINNELFGLSQQYWIDGKQLLSEYIYYGDTSKYLYRGYSPNGELDKEYSIENNKLNGVSKQYYSNGEVKELFSYKNGEFHGLRRYYYKNGQLWIEQIYKYGKPWSVIRNYDSNGSMRNAGTLNNGNGSIIYYNEDNTIREIAEYYNGIKVDKK